MNYVEINGVPYDVIVTRLQRGAEIRQSENAGATLADGAEERLDPIGTFVNYTITFKRKSGKEIVFDNLWTTITKPRYNGVPVKIVYNQTTIQFLAKFEVSPQKLHHIDKKTGKVYWDEITANIIPTKAQVLPL